MPTRECGKVSLAVGRTMRGRRTLPRRETLEETGVALSTLVDLESVSMIPTLDVVGALVWGDDVTELPEHAFCATVPANAQIILSGEHIESRWCEGDEALRLLEWESNKRAILKAEALAY